MGKKNYRKITCAAITVAVIAWIIYIMKPVISVVKYTHSTTDDYWMSFAVHKVWESTHSLPAVFKEALTSAALLYKYHDGCFLSMFLTSLSPVAFNEIYYKYAIYAVFFMLISSIYFASFVFLVKKLRLSVTSSVITGSIFLFLCINYMPSAGEGLYWWPGGVNYTVFFAVFLFTQSFIALYMMKNKIIWLVLSAIFAFVSCQGNLISALIGVCVIFLEALYIMFKGDKKRKFGISIIFLFAFISILISVLAPGNYVRGAGKIGENNIFMTIIQSIKHASLLYVDFNKNNGVVYYIFLIIMSIAAFMNSDTEYKFPYPAAFCVLAYLVYCAGLAPVIFSGVLFYARIHDIIYLYMVLTNTACIIYLSGYISSKIKEKCSLSLDKIKNISLHILGIASGAMIIFSCVNQFNTTAFSARTYLTNGDAQRFDERIMYRFCAYYDDNVKVVEFEHEQCAPGIFFFNDTDTMNEKAYFIFNGTKIAADYFALQDENAQFNQLEYDNLLSRYFDKEQIIMKE